MLSYLLFKHFSADIDIYLPIPSKSVPTENIIDSLDWSDPVSKFIVPASPSFRNVLPIFRKNEPLTVLLLADYNVIDPGLYLRVGPDNNINDPPSPLELSSPKTKMKSPFDPPKFERNSMSPSLKLALMLFMFQNICSIRY